MNERDPYSRSRQQGGQGRDMPRQTEQWQAEPPRQPGELQQDDDSRTAYDKYARERARERAQERDRLTGKERRSQSSPYRSELDSDEWEDYTPESDYAEPRESAPRAYRGTHGHHFYDGAYGNTFPSFTSEDYGGRDFYAGRRELTGGMRSSESYRPSYGITRWFGDEDWRRDRHERDYGEWRAYGEHRGFLARAGDEIASWFGDEDAARRREMDHSGRGPSGYTRSDERIREDANDCLTHDPGVDATNISVSVSDGEVTLDGTVNDRWAKRRAEDAVERVPGVKHVQNNLRMGDRTMSGMSTTASTSMLGASTSNKKTR